MKTGGDEITMKLLSSQGILLILCATLFARFLTKSTETTPLLFIMSLHCFIMLPTPRRLSPGLLIASTLSFESLSILIVFALNSCDHSNPSRIALDSSFCSLPSIQKYASYHSTLSLQVSCFSLRKCAYSEHTKYTIKQPQY